MTAMMPRTAGASHSNHALVRRWVRGGLLAQAGDVRERLCVCVRERVCVRE